MTILDQCLLNLGLFVYSFSFEECPCVSFEECQVCVHYLEITVFTPAINNWCTCKHYYSSSYPYPTLNQMPSFGKNINNDTLNTSR